MYYIIQLCYQVTGFTGLLNAEVRFGLLN